MKIRVSYVVDVSDDYRRAIRRYYGESGMATRKEVQSFLRQNGSTLDDDLKYEPSTPATHEK